MEERSCATCRWRHAPSNRPPCSKCDGYELDKWELFEWEKPVLTEEGRKAIRELLKRQKETLLKRQKETLEELVGSNMSDELMPEEDRPEKVFPVGDFKKDLEEAMKSTTETAVDTERPNGIEDSGERRVFESGAVRDMAEGKGRCDLLPFLEIADALSRYDKYAGWDHELDPHSRTSMFLAAVSPHRGNFRLSSSAYIECVISEAGALIAADWPDPETAVLDLAVHFERGALKYEERNWEKGIPAHSFLDSAIRHFLKNRRGDRDEDHKTACLWNLLCLAWTIRHKPEFDDLTSGEGTD